MDAISDWRQAYPELAATFGETLIVEDFETALIQEYMRTLAGLPIEIHARLLAGGLKEVHIANRPVPELDALQRLRGQPVSANATRTWDEVPGAYTQGVLVAGVGRHGSAALMIHEWGHAIGDILGHNQDGELMLAYVRLQGKLDPFYTRYGIARGSREMFAEGLAVYFSDGREVAVNEFDEAFVQYIEGVIAKERGQ
jgi:hypothetical protein